VLCVRVVSVKFRFGLPHTEDGPKARNTCLWVPRKSSNVSTCVKCKYCPSSFRGSLPPRLRYLYDLHFEHIPLNTYVDIMYIRETTLKANRRDRKKIPYIRVLHINELYYMNFLLPGL